MINNKITKLATWLHEQYELWSKIVNWKTQKSCRLKKFDELPEKNKMVMKHLASVILLKQKRREVYLLNSLDIPLYDDSLWVFNQREKKLKLLKKEIKELNEYKVE